MVGLPSIPPKGANNLSKHVVDGLVAVYLSQNTSLLVIVEQWRRLFVIHLYPVLDRRFSVIVASSLE